jgi:hypothetical protein
MLKPSLLALSLAGCWTTSQPTVTQPAAPDVMVELAAVTLGDDCGGSPAVMAPMDICEGCTYTPHCDQTSMQLSLKATAGTGSTAIQVKKVELLDHRGAFLADLTSRTPTRWNGDAYQPWNQSIEAGRTLSASYMLTAPDWNKLTKGRWNAHTKTFQLRVTLAVGSKDRTVDKQSITPALLEPAVPT